MIEFLSVHSLGAQKKNGICCQLEGDVYCVYYSVLNLEAFSCTIFFFTAVLVLRIRSTFRRTGHDENLSLFTQCYQV